MAKKTATKKDFARVRTSIQEAMNKGLTFDDAVAKAAEAERNSFKKIVDSE